MSNMPKTPPKQQEAPLFDSGYQGPWVDVDFDALCANSTMLRQCAPGAALAPVVKCDAYGLGAAPIARALRDRANAREFFVVYPEEGAALRAALNEGETAIYCLAGPTEESLARFDEAKLIPVINSLEQARLWAGRNPGGAAALHVDTGMNRRGACISALADIAATDGLNITLVMSHLACSSTPGHPMNAAQRSRFIEAAQTFPGARLSLAASGGAMMDADYAFDQIRPGIALYGGSPFHTDDARIHAVAALRAPVVQIRHLAPGETVGYDATFTAERPTRLATVMLGYGDGYPRSGAGSGIAMIGGERARVVGRVSMDFITLDVTDFKKIPEPGDVAEFFGPSLRLFEASEAAGRIAYEFLTGLGARVDRRYV